MSDIVTADTTVSEPALAIKQGVPLPNRPRLLGDLLDHTVARFPDRAAIDFMGKVTSWRALGAAVDRAAAGLQALGVVKGTRVALCLPNTPYYPILFYATLKAGGIVVNVNPLYVERELAHLVQDSGAEIIVAPDVADIQARATSSPVRSRTRCRHSRSLATSSSSARRSAVQPVTRGTCSSPT
jgi:long-chain acyl-CoA synthetase